MQERIITFITGKLAKKLDFDWETDLGFGEHKGNIVTFSKSEGDFFKDLKVNACSQSLLQKWIREVHNIHIEICVWVDNTWSAQLVYSKSAYDAADQVYDAMYMSSYEEALEIGLQKALDTINEQKKSSSESNSE